MCDSIPARIQYGIYRSGQSAHQSPDHWSVRVVSRKKYLQEKGIDCRIIDGHLHLFVYFRSWDAWGGFPANLGAIQLLKEYMAQEISVADGALIGISKGLHLYDYMWESACIYTRQSHALLHQKTAEFERSKNASKG